MLVGILLMLILLGLIWSDGNLTITKSGLNKVSIYSRDLEHISKVHSYFGSDRKIYQSKNWQGNTGNMLLSSSSFDAEFLIAAGLTPNKSLTIIFPSIPEEFRKYFILGFFDGDGCISFGINQKAQKYYPKCTFTCGSLIFITKLKEILDSIDVKSAISIDGRCGTPEYTMNDIYTLSFASRLSIVNFYNYIYSHLDDIPHMSRKKVKFDQYISELKLL